MRTTSTKRTQKGITARTIVRLTVLIVPLCWTQVPPLIQVFMTPSDGQPHNSTYNFNHTYMYCIFDMHCMIVYVLYTVYNIFCSWSLAYVIILPSRLYLQILMSVPIARPISRTPSTNFATKLHWRDQSGSLGTECMQSHFFIPTSHCAIADGDECVFVLKIGCLNTENLTGQLTHEYLSTFGMQLGVDLVCTRTHRQT